MGVSGQPAGWATVPSASGVPPEVRAIAFLADLDRRVGGEFVRRYDEILWRRTLPDAAGSVVKRPVARAEPTAERPAIVAGILPKRDAAEMRAHADHDEPFRLFNARRIRLRIAQFGDVDLLRRLDLLRRAMVDKDRLAAPRHSQPLPYLNRRQIDLGARQRQRVARRVERIDKRPYSDRGADRAERTGGQNQEIAPRAAVVGLVDVRVRRVRHPIPRVCAAYPPAAATRGSYTLESAELCDRLPHKLAAKRLIGALVRCRFPVLYAPAIRALRPHYCVLRCSNPIFPRTLARCCALRRVSMSR